MKYWIIIDDRHAGPFSAQQLVDTGLTADTLVWYEGLPDWTRAANVPELMDCIQHREIADTSTRQQPVVEQAQLQDVAVEDINDAQHAATDQAHLTEPEPAVQTENASWQQPVGQDQTVAAQQTKEPCPPAYIAWSIIATLLCCTVVGIPAIVFASMTKSAYYKGDIAKAKRYSELAQWFIIASIVLGAVSWPFQIAIMGMLP